MKRKMLTSEMLVKRVIANKGQWNATYCDLDEGNFEVSKKPVMEEYFTILDEIYPNGMKMVFHPPFAFFYRGNISLLKNDNIIGICMDNKSEYSWDKLNKVALTDNNHYVGAYRMFDDKEKHDMEFNNYMELASRVKELILVVNCGINRVDTELVDMVVNNGGLVISERPNGVKADIFTDYGRIVSGIESNKLVVIRCEKGSFANTQIMNSLKIGHDIYAMPTIEDEHTENNVLIDDGAYILYSVEQLA